MTEQPHDGMFFIDEAVGVSKDEYAEITAEMDGFAETDMTMVDIVNEVVYGRNPYDIMVGIKLAVLLYKNEGRL